MDPDNLPPNLPEYVRLDILRADRANRIEKESRQIGAHHSNIIEEQVLVVLWKHLGDEAETYWAAMQAAAAFTSVHNHCHDQTRPLSRPVAAHVLEALGNAFFAQAKCIRELAETKERILNDHPLPGDNA